MLDVSPAREALLPLPSLLLLLLLAAVVVAVGAEAAVAPTAAAMLPEVYFMVVHLLLRAGI